MGQGSDQRNYIKPKKTNIPYQEQEDDYYYQPKLLIDRLAQALETGASVFGLDKFFNKEMPKKEYEPKITKPHTYILNAFYKLSFKNKLICCVTGFFFGPTLVSAILNNFLKEILLFTVIAVPTYMLSQSVLNNLRNCFSSYDKEDKSINTKPIYEKEEEIEPTLHQSPNTEVKTPKDFDLGETLYSKLNLLHQWTNDIMSGNSKTH